MRPIVQEVDTKCSPEGLAARFQAEAGTVLLRSGVFDPAHGRYSLLVMRPFLTLRAFGTRIEISTAEGSQEQFGNPWHVLDSLLRRCELIDEIDWPFPLGGCFGFWGYDLKSFVEPHLKRTAINDLDLPDCWAGFYDSVIVFDHALDKTFVVATGLQVDGSRNESLAQQQAAFWRHALAECSSDEDAPPISIRNGPVESNLSRDEFIKLVERAQAYIRAGDIYQVNLAQRLMANWEATGFDLFRALSAISPAPFSAYINAGDFQVVSSSPEQFLRLSGSHIRTRPIKGTRPRAADATRDAQLTFELQTSPKEIAELIMITDLLRNDLGRVCEFGSVQVPELLRLERYAHVQHLVSTVEGVLRSDVSHLEALSHCFPGGSVTGAPKIRAMEIIDELEPVTRGPYTGCLGYLGFNRESQLSITIRTAVCTAGRAWFHAGAGIVADSNPEAEYDETLAKAAGFMAAIGQSVNATGASHASSPGRPCNDPAGTR